MPTGPIKAAATTTTVRTIHMAICAPCIATLASGINCFYRPRQMQLSLDYPWKRKLRREV